jgi:phosphogluconate dehydratase
MSGASGKVPAAIHISPEACKGGLLNKLRTGDVIRFDADQGIIEALVDAAELAARPAAELVLEPQDLGRNLFGGFRGLAGVSQEGASVFNSSIDFD